MSSFTYIALDKNGLKISGKLKAADRGEALRQLDRKGLRPTKLELEEHTKPENKDVKLKKKKTSSARQASSKTPSKLTTKRSATSSNDGKVKLKRTEVILFTEELSDMLTAGLQLEPALRSMENRQESGNLQEVSRGVRALVRDGTSFSRSLQQVSPSFGPLYTSMAAAGEASGALHTILKRQAHYLKTLGELQNKVILAMIYPIFLIFAGIGVTFIFVTQLIPQLTTLLTNTPGAKVPVGAKILISVSDFLSAWWWAFLIFFIIGGLIFKGWKDIEANKPVWDRVKLKLPLTGRVIADRFYVQFLETMSNLIGNGLTLLRSLELTRDATQNLHLRHQLDNVIEQVGDGRALSSSLIKTGSFPELLIDMVAVGEQTGQLDVSLARAAERYDKELNNSLQRVMALIMPTILLIMAFLIGLMAYLMLTAIFQTIQALG